MKYLLVIFYLIASSFSSSAQTNNLTGHWEGGINRLGSIQILRFDIYAQADSIWATCDDPAVAVFNSPFYMLQKQGDTLLMNFGYGKFKAVLHDDVNEITGINSDWDPRLDLNMHKYGQKAKPNFVREDILLKNGNISISASLLKPAGTEKFPLVVLVHAFDKAVRSTGYYYSIAHNLAESGVGVLFYDKRGCGQTTGDFGTVSFNDLAADALVAIQYLKSRKDLPLAKIGLLGTSQGAWVSYMAAKKSKDIQFVVANAGAAVSLFQQEIDRVQFSMQADGRGKESIDSAIIYIRNYFQYVNGEIDWNQFQLMIKGVENSTFTNFIRLPKEDKDENFLWWRRNSYDPASDLSFITCPVLSILCEKDVLVPPATNEELMRKYLTKAAVPFQIKIFPDCKHSGETISTLKGDDWKFPEKFWVWKRKAPGFYETITAWIKGI